MSKETFSPIDYQPALNPNMRSAAGPNASTIPALIDDDEAIRGGLNDQLEKLFLLQGQILGFYHRRCVR